jgi:hypothetical protein
MQVQSYGKKAVSLFLVILNKIKSLQVLPDLIIFDVMTNKVDGYAFVRILSNSSAYGRFHLFLSQNCQEQ